MISSKEIAELAGVSRGTVDRALHGRKGISREMSARILKIAAEHGYVPDRAGRALSSRRTPMTIGVVFHTKGNPFFKDVIRGIRAAEAEYADFRLKVDVREIGEYDAQVQADCIKELVKNDIKALIITPVNDPIVSNMINDLEENGIPTICINSDIAECKRRAYVGCDYVKSGKVAAGLAGLMTQSRKRPVKAGVVIGTVKILGHTQRVYGFSEVCRSDFKQIHIMDIIENMDSDEYSYQVVSKLLAKQELDFLYFAAAGVAGGLKAVKESGQTPLIIACDEIPATTKGLDDGVIQALVTQQPYEQGYRAVCCAFAAASDNSADIKDCYMRNDIVIRYNQSFDDDSKK